MNFQQKSDADRVSNAQRVNWILGLLLVAAVVTAGVFYSQNQKLNDSGHQLALTLDQLDKKQLALEEELIDLDSNYQVQILANDSLGLTLEERVAEIDKLQGRLWTMKKKLEASQQENAHISDRLAQLSELKTALEADIIALNTTNAQLKEENDQLAVDLQISQDEIADLTVELQDMSLKNQKLTARLFEVAPAGFVANNFSVTAKKKNEKLTARAKQAERISISFDINDVPEEYQEQEEIYLVVTKFDGNPINELDTREFTVKSALPIEIQAADVAQTTLKDRQSVEMSIQADRDLESGMYNVLVYADHGFLGATTFQLQ